MSQPISYLLYVSRAIVPANSAEEAAICLDARIYNRGNGITGILHREDDWFAQYLEGTEMAVRAAFFRVRKDWRHTDIQILSQGTSDARRFARADMAFSSPETARFADFQAAAGREGRPGSASAEDLIAFFAQKASRLDPEV